MKLQKKSNEKEKQKLYMKCHTSNTKGITLIALIITIVIMLILAIVTINAVQGDGIIGYAKRAKTEWEKASEEEQNQLIDLEVDVAGGPWKLEGEGVVNIKTKEELKVGDYVKYDPTAEGTDGNTNDLTSYTSPKEKTGANSEQKFEAKSSEIKWRVLDVQNGKIRLISETFIEPTEGGQEYSGTEKTNGEKDGHHYYTLKGKEGFINAIDELNNICAIFGYGKGAESATSITVEDINAITGYNPTTKKYKEGNYNEYGNKVTYTKGEDGSISSSATNNATESSEEQEIKTFNYYDKKTKSFVPLTKGSIDIMSTAYMYYPTTLTEKNSTENVEKVKENSNIYEMLFGNQNKYWVASDYAATHKNYVVWGLRRVDSGNIGGSNLYNSKDSRLGYSFGARPVVTLKSDVKLVKGTVEGNVDGWNINEE